MPKEFLDGPNVRSSIEHVCGERMSEHVGMVSSGPGDPPEMPPDDSLHRSLTDRALRSSRKKRTTRL
jgi:hypothetical protein